MSDKARRKELVAEYKRTHPEAGIYRIVNERTGKALLASSANLASVRNKLEFARSTNTPGALDLRLKKDIAEFGIDAFSLEILDVLETRPEMTSGDIREELATLEQIWREQQEPSQLY